MPHGPRKSFTPFPRHVGRAGKRSRMLRGHQDLDGFVSWRLAKASRSPLCVAAETAWGPFRLSIAGERGGAGDAVLMVTLVAFSPMDRAASINCASASRNLACQTGDSTRKTRCSSFTFASLQWLRRVSGKWGRNCWSNASSHKARRSGFPVLSPMTASSAGFGADAGRPLDFGSDMKTH